MTPAERILKLAEPESISRLLRKHAPSTVVPINEVASDVDYYLDAARADGISIGITSENTRLRPLIAELVRCFDDLDYILRSYDCDSDAHKYGTPCRCCLAEKRIAALELLVEKMEKENGNT